ncbi:YopX family protein [Listeria sp. ILCC797]|uniref:YopX family protein n=1 Tax=Listeria sp. ILCC797 TaxID=1918333 RepID=UPI000B587BBD|nr:YopX family protein [Listeria sp. ILCC797]
MREIEFRVWHDESGTLQTVKELTFDDGGHLGYLESRDEHGKAHGFYPCIDSIELMQFTGLHDKNGKKIFEGDIVRVEREFGGSENAEVHYTEYMELCAGRWILHRIRHSAEVVGNKWQNPELLEAE